MSEFKDRALNGRVNVRLRLMQTSAIGACAIASVIMSGAAQAQDECGSLASGTVTCTTTDNPYADGISYSPVGDDLTVVLANGTRVNTTGGLNPGIAVVGDGALTVEGAADTIITTDADNAFGAVVVSQSDAVAVRLDRINTSGDNALGVLAGSFAGDVAVRTNTINTAGVGSAGIIAAAPSGDVTINSGVIATTGQSAVGIQAVSNAGDISINSRTINTSGAGGFVAGIFPSVGSSGILATTGGTGTIAINSEQIATTGSFATGITASNDTGRLTVTSGTISTTGAEADGINVTSAGTANVNTGAISTTGLNADGVVATGGSAANVTFTNITTTGENANGVLVPAGVLLVGPQASAAATVNGANVSTIGATSDGIRAIAGTGEAAVNVTGNVTTRGANSRGIFAAGPAGVTVNNGGTISTAGVTSNGVDAASATGPVSVTVRNVTTTGAGSNAVLVNATTGNATAVVNGALNASGAGASALTVNSGGNAVVNVAAGGSVAATQGNSINIASVGTSTLNNAGTIGNNTGGFALVATGGPITINNTGTFSSDLVLTAGADRINNSGTFAVVANPNFGAGNDVFANSGAILVGTGASANVAPVFTGLESLTNTGTIDLRNGRAGDTLTLPGTYVGTNGTLGLDVLLNGTTNPGDQLIVGGAATGTTTVALNQLAGSQPVFNPGTVLVNAGVGSSANAFDLAGGSLDAGFVRYEVGYNAATGDFALTGAPSDTAYRTLNYVNGIRSLWYKSADAVNAQLRARRDALWTGSDTDTAGRFWLQMHASTETREGQRDFNTFGQSRLTNTGFEQNYFGGQIGFDIAGGSEERGGFAAGVTGGYVRSTQAFAGSTDELQFDVANAGVYASYTSGNLFVNALGKYDHYWSDMRAANNTFHQSFEGGVYGAQGEVGFRFGSDTFFVEPAASISWVKNDFDDFSPVATNVSFDEDEGLRGRAGGRIGTQFALGQSVLGLYAGANYVHEFQGEDTVTFTGGGQTLTYTNEQMDDFGEANIGLSFFQSPNVSAFMEGNYTRSFNKNDGDLGIEGFGGRAGFRVKF